MFRAILYQLLVQTTTVRQSFNAIWEEKRRVQGDDVYHRNWRLDELRNLLSSLLLTAAESENIRIFIDALDEAGEESAKDLLSYLYRLGDDIRESEACVSICFSCRKYPVFASHGGLEILVDHENYNDIAVYTAAELDRHLVNDTNHVLAVETLHADFAQKALGVFLWASLMIPVVAKLYNDGAFLGTIRQRLDRVPSDLSKIYEHILKNVVDAEKRPKTLRLMQLVFLGERPLSHMVVHSALTFDDDIIPSVQYAFHEGPESGDWKDFESNDIPLERSVLSVSGGLAETNYHGRRPRLSRVEFIHESVNDFLREDQFRCLDFTYSIDPVGESHYQILLSCLKYAKWAFSNLSPAEGLNGRNEELGMCYPFIVYATTRWSFHAKRAELQGVSLAELVQLFDWPSQEFFMHWIRFYMFMIERSGTHPDPGYKNEGTLLHVAAAFNLATFMRALLNNGAEVDKKDQDGNTPLTYAVAYEKDERNSHKAAVQVLIDHGANINGHGSRLMNSPLSRAAKVGDEELVRYFIGIGSDLNACGTVQYENEDMTPLTAAARSRSENSLAIARILLDSGAELEASSGRGWTALVEAVASKNFGVTQLLLERGAKIDPIVDGKAINLLERTANKEDQGFFRLLLRHGAPVSDEARRWMGTLHRRAINFGPSATPDRDGLVYTWPYQPYQSAEETSR